MLAAWPHRPEPGLARDCQSHPHELGQTGTGRLTDGQVPLENDPPLRRVLRHMAQLPVQVPLQPAGELQLVVMLLVRAPEPLQQLRPGPVLQEAFLLMPGYCRPDQSEYGGSMLWQCSPWTGPHCPRRICSCTGLSCCMRNPGSSCLATDSSVTACCRVAGLCCNAAGRAQAQCCRAQAWRWAAGHRMTRPDAAARAVRFPTLHFTRSKPPGTGTRTGLHCAGRLQYSSVHAPVVCISTRRKADGDGRAQGSA